MGDVAPDFQLKDQNNKLVKLSQFKGKKEVVLFFYPKDDTPGCTKGTCSVRPSVCIGRGVWSTPDGSVSMLT